MIALPIQQVIPHTCRCTYTGWVHNPLYFLRAEKCIYQRLTMADIDDETADNEVPG